ncbi:hypothetical protein BN1723_020270, partial [Verticillium longisporum]
MSWSLSTSTMSTLSHRQPTFTAGSKSQKQSPGQLSCLPSRSTTTQSCTRSLTGLCPARRNTMTQLCTRSSTSSLRAPRSMMMLSCKRSWTDWSTTPR